MKIRPWLCALLMGSFLVGLTACSDSSDEVDALRTQVEELQAQVRATSTRAPAATEAPGTTRAPATTTTQERFTAEEEAWIESELSTFVSADLEFTTVQGRCILQGFVEARGITGAGELVDRVSAELDSGRLLSASDADAFLEPVVACVNLVGITLPDIRRAAPGLDASCMVNGLQESQVADWYRTAFVEGQEAMQAAMNEWMSSRIPGCTPVVGAWESSVEQDPWDDSWKTTLRLDAVESITFTDPSFRSSTHLPVLILECIQGKQLVMAVTGDRLRFSSVLTNSAEFDRVPVKYRIGDEPAESAEGFVPVEFRYFVSFSWKGEEQDRVFEMIRDLRGASQMLVELDAYALGPHQTVRIKFDTRGFDHHLPLLTKHCPGQL